MLSSLLSAARIRVCGIKLSIKFTVPQDISIFHIISIPDRKACRQSSAPGASIFDKSKINLFFLHVQPVGAVIFRRAAKHFSIYRSTIDFHLNGMRRRQVKSENCVFDLPLRPASIFDFVLDRMRLGIVKSENCVFDLPLPSAFTIFAITKQYVRNESQKIDIRNQR